MFSLQLSDHDALFAPHVKVRRRFRWLRLIVYLPAVLIALFPSYRLGIAKWVKPNFQILDHAELGDIFTFPADDDSMEPEVSGHPIAYVAGRQPYYLVAAVNEPDFQINIQYNDDDHRLKLKSLLPSTKFPSFPLFFQNVRVSHPSAKPPIPRGKIEIAVPAFADSEKAVFNHSEGTVRLRCWKEPKVEPLGIDPLAIRKIRRLASLGAVGPGEVLAVSAGVAGETTVIVYHGGGVYSRYWGLKDAKVSKGTRVTTGQIVGYLVLPMKFKELPAPTWQILMASSGGAVKEIKEPSLLALSSQLCDSK